MRDTFLYKTRKNIWGEEIRKGKGCSVENMLPENFQYIGAGLFLGLQLLPFPPHLLF